MAKNQDDRQQKRDYLSSLAKAGKVTNPTEAHAALKAKFGGSLTFGEVGTILGRSGSGSKKKGQRGPARAKARSRAPGRRGGRRAGGANKNAVHKFAIRARGEYLFAADRSEMQSRVERLIEQGTSAADVSVYDLRPRKMSVKITF